MNIQLPPDLDRNCPDCGQMMDVSVNLDVKKGEDEVTNLCLECPNEDCPLVAVVRKWSQPSAEEEA